MIVCNCDTIRTRGFKNVHGWWVCNKCELPTPLYLRAMTEKGFSMGLIYFEGGPLDGQAYESKSLLGGQGLLPQVGEYNWTSDKKTSASSGSTAQVWRWKESGAPVAPPSHDEAELAAAVHYANAPSQPVAATGTSDTAAPVTHQMAGTAHPTVEARQATAAAAAPNGSVSNQAGPTYTPAKPKVEKQPAAPGDVPDGQDGPTLRKRREALKPKMSRSDFAALVNMSAARVDRVERELGNKPMLEERATIAAKLDELEGVTAGAH